MLLGLLEGLRYGVEIVRLCEKMGKIMLRKQFQLLKPDCYNQNFNYVNMNRNLPVYIYTDLTTINTSLRPDFILAALAPLDKNFAGLLHLVFTCFSVLICVVDSPSSTAAAQAAQHHRLCARGALRCDSWAANFR